MSKAADYEDYCNEKGKFHVNCKQILDDLNSTIYKVTSPKLAFHNQEMLYKAMVLKGYLNN